MSHFAAYVHETRGMSTIERDFGFATYIIHDGECYIEDIFIAPQFRKTGEGSRLADEIVKIAKDQGCHALIGTVNGRIKDPSSSTAALLSYGFKITRILQDAIFFRMEI